MKKFNYISNNSIDLILRNKNVNFYLLFPIFIKKIIENIFLHKQKYVYADSIRKILINVNNLN